VLLLLLLLLLLLQACALGKAAWQPWLALQSRTELLQAQR